MWSELCEVKYTEPTITGNMARAYVNYVPMWWDYAMPEDIYGGQ